MKSKKRVWISIIVILALLLMAFSFYLYSSLFWGPLRGGLSPNEYLEYRKNSGVLMSTEEIKRKVNRLISDFDEELEIADIFVYEDSDYYISVEEVNTGKGAMELLINPYSGVVYPEHGPNMMWNEKYGMHGRRNRMGMHMQNQLFFNEYSGYYSNEELTKQISREAAVELATEYVKRYIDEELHVTKEAMSFMVTIHYTLTEARRQ